MTDIFMMFAGLLLLFFGGESLIKGAVSLARNFNLSKLLVSAVVIGFGTSMPEMTVSVSAALKGAPDIAVGNVVGSNIANVLLIVGAAAILHPVFVTGDAVKRDMLIMLGASAILCVLALMGNITFIAGLLLFIAVVTYIGASYVRDKKTVTETTANTEPDSEAPPRIGSVKASIYVLVGLVLLVLGAYILVENAVVIARDFGLSEAVIGLTVVAVGASLPELATAIVAAYRKHSDVIIGNIIGSNIFNILAILGVTAMISPVPVAARIAHIDVWIMLGVAGFLSLYFLRGSAIGRISGFIMLTAYGAYTAWLYIGTAA